MKRVIRLVPILAGVVAVGGGWGLSLPGCGNSSSSSTSDAGPTDATVDGQGEDAFQEGATSDADTGTASDAPSDAGVASDADAGAASDADAGSEASLPITVTAETFPGQLAATLCTTIAACCGTSGDAATFNWQSCYNSKLAAGYNGSNTGVNIDGGHLTFNAAQAQTCLNTIASVDCASNQVTSAEEAPLYQSCFGAYTGTLAMGSPCAATIECAQGNFCAPVDGGVGDAGATGLCQPLAGVGGACGVFGDQALGQTVCSYRGAASNGLFCQNISGDAGISQLSPSNWTCQPQWPVNSECYTNQDCASFICHQFTSGFLCASAGNLANATTCSTYAVALPDGGAD